jgi:hypothetical protein
MQTMLRLIKNGSTVLIQIVSNRVRITIRIEGINQAHQTTAPCAQHFDNLHLGVALIPQPRLLIGPWS